MSDDPLYSVLCYVNLVVTDVWIFRLSSWASLFSLVTGAWCVFIFLELHRLLFATFHSGCWYLISMTFFLPPMASRSLPTAAFVLCEELGVARSINIVSGTPFSSTVRVCRWTLIMQFGPSALGSNLLFVRLSVVFELFVFTASSCLSTNTDLIFLNTVFSRTRLL